MKAADVCDREVATIGLDDTVVEAARIMRDRHVGDLVVVQGSGREARPLAVVTDRDIVLEGVAVHPEQMTRLRVRDVVEGRPLVAVAPEASVGELLHRMGLHGVRRVVVVDPEGRLIGIVSLDDVLTMLSTQMGELATLVDRELEHEHQQRT